MLLHPWTVADAAAARQVPPPGESLQADVMRFLAILGLCLMAIFALVHSIPDSTVPPAEAAPSPVEPLRAPDTGVERLREEISSLTLEAHEARRLRDATLNEARAQRQAADQAAKALTQIQDAYRRQFAQLANLRQSIESKRRRLQALGRDQAAAAREEQVSETHETDGGLPEPPARERSAGTSPTAEIAPAPAPTRQPTADPANAVLPARAASASRGFVLRFASDEALHALVRRDVVSLYAIDEGDAWRVRISGGTARLVSAPRPRALHVMEPDTVPASLLALYAGHANDSSSRRPVWGVLLPDPIRRQVADLTRTAVGGTLTIDQTGHVDLASRRGAH